VDNALNVMQFTVYNASDLNLTNVHYVLADIILIVVRVFNAMKVVPFVQVQEMHNVNNVQQIIISMTVMVMEQESVGIVMIVVHNVLLQLTVNV